MKELYNNDRRKCSFILKYDASKQNNKYIYI